MNNIAQKLHKCWTQKIAFKIISKMLKQPHFFHSQPSTLPKEALAKFYLSTTFGLSFMISSVAPARSSTSCIEKISSVHRNHFIFEYGLNSRSIYYHTSKKMSKLSARSNMTVFFCFNYHSANVYAISRVSF